MRSPLLPVRTRLGPRPRRDLLADVPPEVTAKPPAAFTDALGRVPVFEQVDHTSHPLGWKFDLTHFVSLAEAEQIGWSGEA